MSDRTSKKGKAKAQAIAKAAEEAAHTRREAMGDSRHLYYANPGVDVHHLSPRARKMLGVPGHQLFTG
jgi:hypothetical protein